MSKKANGFYLKGKSDDGVLLCHTLAGEPEQMKELGLILQQNGYHVSCPLYKGHGSTFSELIQTDASMWYQDVKDSFMTLRSNIKGNIFVVGMSIGGSFTVKLAQEVDVAGICTINAPIIGFDVKTDVQDFSKKFNNKEEVIHTYHTHRSLYFDLVVELGQIHNIQKITCPLFTLQGTLDGDRYKTSTMMLQRYTNSSIKQRIDYPKSEHLLLLGPDKEQAIQDIVQFINKI